MDVCCANCKEPWDIHHLWHDAVHETAAGQEMIDDELDLEDWDKEMCSLSYLSLESLKKHAESTKPEPRYKGEPWERKLTNFWREQFKADGWEFGSSVIAVLHCPCCVANGKCEGADERRDLILCADELLTGDEDGLAVTLQDMEHNGTLL